MGSCDYCVDPFEGGFDDSVKNEVSLEDFSACALYIFSTSSFEEQPFFFLSLDCAIADLVGAVDRMI